MEVKIINKSHHPLPGYATPLSAGMDIRANLAEPVVLKPLERKLIPTGLYIALPEGYDPAQVAEKLNPYASRIIAVRGNCDSEVDQMLLHFPITAPWQQVLLEHHRLFLTHGHLFSPDNLPALAAGDVLVYGHTHIPVAEKRGEIYHFNPGSVSIPKGGYPASYGMLDGNTLSVIALNDQQVIAQVAINP